MYFFSIITPVYNRPQEVAELLESLAAQTYTNFEVIIIEDGSTLPSKEITELYADKLKLQYHFLNKVGPSEARNYGFNVAKGDYFVLFDSDCIIPPDYFTKVVEYLSKDALDAYGGPDQAHASFTATQKAINYAMTALLTTGGIRGRKKRVGKFHPRSFNLAVTKGVVEEIGGFIKMHPGEDIEWIIRVIKRGFKVGLIPDAFVYHKRRTDFVKFFKQVYKFGKARIDIALLHPSELKITHFFPLAFTLYMLIACVLPLIHPLGVLAPASLGVYFLAVLLDSTLTNKNLAVGLLSVWATFIQMTGYAAGFGWHILKRWILRIRD